MLQHFLQSNSGDQTNGTVEVFQSTTADDTVYVDGTIIKVENSTVYLYRPEKFRQFTVAVCNESGSWQMEEGLVDRNCFHREYDWVKRNKICSIEIDYSASKFYLY